MTRIDAVRQQSQRVLAILLGAFAAVYALAALFVAPERLVAGTVFLLLVAGCAFASVRLAPQAAATRMTMAAGLIAFPAALTWLASGSAWQLDMHMIFFAALSVATLLCDWRAIVTAAAVTAVHHLVLNFALPLAVFPGGADFGRVLLHAAVVIGQTAVLVWLSQRIVGALDNAGIAIAEAEAANLQARQLAEADRERSVQIEAGRVQVNALASDFEHTVAGVLADLREVSRQMQALAADVRGDAGQTRSGADEAAGRSAETSGHFEAVAAAAQELAASISEVSRIMEGADAVSERATGEAQKAGDSMRELDKAGREVEAIAGLVADIAEQTNLLALNATIEAARAGEAGKGFAVVASEVKALAEQTSKATSDIRARIEAITSASQGAGEALSRISEILGEVRASSASARQAFGEQSGATNEIAALAGKAAASTGGINSRIEDVRSAAGRTLAAADRFAGSSQALGEAADRLDTELTGFRESLRSAS
ncbi:MAG: methyl-accepting chemotaxis protein [Caulobacterales bacterium]|uniref:methyl-accepting chemotaxis protein n=1 Tax=Glycocaulis sp. TaxID=1969725 RepID=UPI003F9EDF37